MLLLIKFLLFFQFFPGLSWFFPLFTFTNVILRGKAPKNLMGCCFTSLEREVVGLNFCFCKNFRLTGELINRSVILSVSEISHGNVSIIGDLSYPSRKSAIQCRFARQSALKMTMLIKKWLPN